MAPHPCRQVRPRSANLALGDANSLFNLAGCEVAVAQRSFVPDREAREIGKLAVWTVTSAKPGSGVELLRDGRDDTYWQSDGTQPHLVNIQFQKKVHVSQVALLLDFKLDESYTPSRVSVRAGTTVHDLRELQTVDLEEPVGWVAISLNLPNSTRCLKAYFVQLAVLANHQNGRDTHIRQIKIFGPRMHSVHALGHPVGFTTDEFSTYGTLR